MKKILYVFKISVIIILSMISMNVQDLIVSADVDVPSVRLTESINNINESINNVNSTLNAIKDKLPQISKEQNQENNEKTKVHSTIREDPLLKFSNSIFSFGKFIISLLSILAAFYGCYACVEYSKGKKY